MNSIPFSLRNVWVALIFLTAGMAGKAKAQVPQSFPDAVAYNDYIVGLQMPIIRAILDFSNDEEAMFNVQKGNQRVDAIVRSAEQGLQGLKGVKPYTGGEALLKAANDLFAFYKTMSHTEFRRMVEILSSIDGEFPEAAATELGQISQRISAAEAPLDEAFQSAQQRFAKQHNFTIQPNEIQQEIDKL
jgi:hypothetical protein